MKRLLPVLTTVFELIGMAAIVTGVWMVSVPAGLVLGGVFLFLIGVIVA